MRHLMRLTRVCALALLSAPFLVSCGSAPAHTTQAALTDAPNTITLLAGKNDFAPFILPVTPGTTVTWRDDDAVGHTITTSPAHNVFLNPAPFHLTVAPGQSVSFTFTQPGIYDYYDDQLASWNIALQRVVANKDVVGFPMAMEGVIWVQGNIPGLPLQEKNSVLYLHDDIVKDFIAIRVGGTVTWHNYDTDAHFFVPVLGWNAPINPVDIGINNLLGSDEAPPNGQSRDITFTTPGLYYYACFTHTDIDPVSLRVRAHDTASEYPVPMEGFVLVVGA